jgi:hypothetical protein
MSSLQVLKRGFFVKLFNLVFCYHSGLIKYNTENIWLRNFFRKKGGGHQLVLFLSS